MRISVIGCGYLGAVHSACMASLGHDVVGIDVDRDKVEALSNALPPFFEPRLPELLETQTAAGRLTYSTDISATAAARVHFIAVGTPQQFNQHAADLSYVHQAVDALVPYLAPGDLVVGKSTVPVGTARQIAATISRRCPEATLVWNPEFLREGFAVQDTLIPNRLVYGLPDDDRVGWSDQAGHAARAGQTAQAGTSANGTRENAQSMLDAVYQHALANGCPRLVMDYETAELVKVSANAFLATKISFINAMSEVCEAAGADVSMLSDAIGYDDRIGRKFLNAGLGFGGGCLPKDIRAFMARADELGAEQALTFLREVDSINMRRRARMVDLTRQACGGSLLGKRVAVLGLAFKPDSDDVRDSPALNVAAQLQLQGAAVTATDPEATANAAQRFPELNYAETTAEAVEDADVVLVLTEWQQYRSLDPAWLSGQVARTEVVDGRNCLDGEAWRAAGWTYRALGRPELPAAVPAPA
ncbi:UDP-glucose dehydrogenase family protein [Arthrobacter castelli]|uniref:UDP-glucose dehydrogenase family protein n=1 Tax=Arthrobacter castelli TaxID=271431 RepID=UPI0003FA5EFD|nr:UDP-glucose/GDP-mannose dehydrogenase family protein [Arthrobacter castelli]